MKRVIGACLLITGASTSLLSLAVPAVVCGLWLVIVDCDNFS